MAAPLLEAIDIEAGYGRIQVLWQASLAVDAGQAVVLLGANGAGKTTLIKTILGMIRLWRGNLRFCEADIAATPTDRRVRAGIAYMSEVGCFPGLSVDENLRVGGQFLQRRLLDQRIDELYRTFAVIKEKRKALAGSLSGGQRKILGIAKALVGQPKLLVMDEPSAGLSPLFVNDVIDVLNDFRGRGLSLLIAEQNVKFLDLADRVYVLEGGRIAFTGTMPQLRADDALRRAYFGMR